MSTLDSTASSLLANYELTREALLGLRGVLLPGVGLLGTVSLYNDGSPVCY
jgi:hypothetical protein